MPEQTPAEEALAHIIDVLKNYVGAEFPGELTRQGKPVPINGFSALCIQGIGYMDAKWGQDWQRRPFSDLNIDEAWDRIENSAVHNFLWKLQQAIEAGEKALDAS